MIEAQRSLAPKALLYPSAQVYEWATTLVVAPYPDHQLLSCGGAIALLRQMGYRVRTLFVGDGGLTLKESSPETIIECRTIAQRESAEAMAYVGVCQEANVCLGLRDGLFPHQGQPGFEESVRLVLNELDDLEPDTILLPLLADDQPDLLATYQIVREALRRFPVSVRQVEYALLAPQVPKEETGKPTAEHKVWRLDVREVLDQKLDALRSLQRHHAARMPVLESIRPWETYVET